MSKQEITDKRRSNCPISLSLDIFGDKWSLLILRDIVFFNKRHNRDFAQQEKIATNILADRLSRFVAHGLLIREIDPDNKSAYIYSLTEKGIQLVPVLVELLHWGAQHTPNSIANEAFLKRIEVDRPGAIKELIDRLRVRHNVLPT